MKQVYGLRSGGAQHSRTAAILGAVGVALPLILGAAPASAETRGYLISWFAVATNNPEFATNCPEAAKDPNRVKFAVAEDANIARRKYKAIVNGQEVAPNPYPSAVPDPNIETVTTGTRAYGFDLGGPAKNKFIEVDTKEKVDNQLWRAVGCTTSFQATPPVLPYSETADWLLTQDTSPGYVIQVSGADLNKDGPVKVTLDRTIRHPERDATGAIRSNVTYVLDPSPRSHNEFDGEIKNGVLTIKPGKYLYMVGTMPFYTQIDLENAHMRLHSEPGGKMVGYWGGYTDWQTWVYCFTARPAGGADGIALFHALKKLADYDPDPVTKQNRKISMTWRLEAVPVFLATLEGSKVVATASEAGLGGKVRQPPPQQQRAEEPAR